MLDTAQPLRFGVGPDTHALGPIGSEADAPLSKAETARAERIARAVRDLPDDGALVVVHCHSAIGPYRDAIRALRGEAVAKVTRVVAAPSLREEIPIVRDSLIPVFRDHLVQEQREHRRAVLNAWRL